MMEPYEILAKSVFGLILIGVYGVITDVVLDVMKTKEKTEKKKASEAAFAQPDPLCPSAASASLRAPQSPLSYFVRILHALKTHCQENSQTI